MLFLSPSSPPSHFKPACRLTPTASCPTLLKRSSPKPYKIQVLVLPLFVADTTSALGLVEVVAAVSPVWHGCSWGCSRDCWGAAALATVGDRSLTGGACKGCCCCSWDCCMGFAARSTAGAGKQVLASTLPSSSELLSLLSSELLLVLLELLQLLSCSPSTDAVPAAVAVTGAVSGSAFAPVGTGTGHLSTFSLESDILPSTSFR